MTKLTKPARDRISATKFAFPTQRKEPLENAAHVRNAAARFNQVSSSAGVLLPDPAAGRPCVLHRALS